MRSKRALQLRKGHQELVSYSMTKHWGYWEHKLTAPETSVLWSLIHVKESATDGSRISPRPRVPSVLLLSANPPPELSPPLPYLHPPSGMGKRPVLAHLSSEHSAAPSSSPMSHSSRWRWTQPRHGTAHNSGHVWEQGGRRAQGRSKRGGQVEDWSSWSQPACTLSTAPSSSTYPSHPGGASNQPGSGVRMSEK